MATDLAQNDPNDVPARIHLLPAKSSPFVLVIRRKPTRCFHIMRWSTRRNTLEHGSWFRGRLFPKRCDISPDGQWMVYLAHGAQDETWNGICRLPRLRTFAEANNGDVRLGGGYWQDHQTLCLNDWEPQGGTLPFRISRSSEQYGDLGVLYLKWERDGWRRRGDYWGEDRWVRGSKKYMIERVGDDGWQCRPTPKHPALIARYVGYLKHGYTFRYHLAGHGDLIDDDVDSACWDWNGRLLFSRHGVLHRYTLDQLLQGKPGSMIDLEGLEPPRRPPIAQPVDDGTL